MNYILKQNDFDVLRVNDVQRNHGGGSRVYKSLFPYEEMPSCDLRCHIYILMIIIGLMGKATTER